MSYFGGKLRSPIVDITDKQQMYDVWNGDSYQQNLDKFISLYHLFGYYDAHALNRIYVDGCDDYHVIQLPEKISPVKREIFKPVGDSHEARTFWGTLWSEIPSELNEQSSTTSELNEKSSVENTTPESNKKTEDCDEVVTCDEVASNEKNEDIAFDVINGKIDSIVDEKKKNEKKISDLKKKLEELEQINEKLSEDEKTLEEAKKIIS